MGKKPKSKKTAAAVASIQRIEEEFNSNQEEESTKDAQAQPPSFPTSDYFIKAMSCLLKGNRYKFNKLIFQGSAKGCTYCSNLYVEVFLYGVDSLIAIDGAATLGFGEGINRMNIHLAFPFCLEGAIRGSEDSIMLINKVTYAAGKESCNNTTIRSMRNYEKNPAMSGSDCFDIKTNMYAINLYWQKYYDKQGWTNSSTKKTMKKGHRRKIKSSYGNVCHGCFLPESDTVTLEKCGGCNFYFYCSTECQKKMWRDGGHEGECRQLAILKQYHRPHGKHIRDRLVNGVDSKDIPELQELRRRLGLDKPKPEYEDLLEQVKSGHIESCELIFPNKDGTVQIGSFPHPM